MAKPLDKIDLTPAQQKYIGALQKRLLDFQQAAQAELNKHQAHIQEALNYVREELKIPEGEAYTLAEDASHLFRTPPKAP
jgi:hypothetical protein